MRDWTGVRVLIAGAGVMGLAAAVELARAGARIIVADGAGQGDNASGVAAGMLAPVGEAVMDAQSTDRFELFLHARDQWPDFVADMPGAILRSGVLLFGDEAKLVRGQAMAERAGAEASLIGARDAEAMSPGLSAPGPALFSPDDWRLDPPVLLQRLRGALEALGGRVIASHVAVAHDDEVVLASGQRIGTEVLVLATGLPPRGLEHGLPELQFLAPIKGQLVRFDHAGPRAGPIVRTAQGYVVPGTAGACVGATMEPGVDDLEVTDEAVARLRWVGEALFPNLCSAPATPGAGVRSAAPDSLPLVGPSSREGVLLTLGVRRNGWLLAPLAARILRTGEGAEAALFDPLRGLSPGGRPA